MQVRTPTSAPVDAPWVPPTGDRSSVAVAPSRFGLAVLLGSGAVVLGSVVGGDGAGAATAVAVALVIECSLLVGTRRRASGAAPTIVLVALVGLLVCAGPFIGRAAVVVVAATTTLAHLVVVGLGPARRWPARAGSFTAALAAVQVLWLAGLETAAASTAAVAVVLCWEDCRRAGTAADPVTGARCRARGLAVTMRRSSAAGRRALRTRAAGLPRWVDDAVLVVLTVVWSAPLFHAFASTRGTAIARIAGWFNDFPAHLRVVDRLGLDPVVVPPHPLFHLATRLGGSVVPREVAATAVLSGCAGVAAWGLLRLGRRADGSGAGLGRAGALAFAGTLVVAESPAVLLMVTGAVSPLSTFAPLHVWNSPTETVALAATLVLLPFLLDAVEGRVPVDERSRWRRLSWLVVLATIAKPTFTMVLVPALPVYLWLAGRWSTVERRRLLRHVTVPTLVVLAVQMGSLVLFAPEEYRVGLTLDPFAMVRHFGIGASGPVYFAGPLVVALALWAGGRRYVAEPAVGLAWTALAISLVPLLLLRETGPMANDGNTAKLSIICWLVVVTVTVRFVASHVRRGERVPARGPWLVATLAYGAAALASGAMVWWVMVVRDGVG